MTRVQLADLGVRSEIGSGGQGTVYAVAWNGAPWPVVYKEYQPSVRSTVNVPVLERMIGLANTPVQGCAAWPYAVVTQDGRMTGFVMRRVPSDYHLWLRLPNGTQSEVLGQAQHLLNEDDFLASRGIPVHDRWRLQFLRDTAESLALLHANAIVVGDLSPMNLLASFSSTPRCFFIDCDAMRLAGESVLPQVETTGWEVPAGQQTATPASDAFKFALLAVRLFARDQESRDPRVLGPLSPDLERLAADGLQADSRRRPPPSAWLAALDSAVPNASTLVPPPKPSSVRAAHVPAHAAAQAASPPFSPASPAPALPGSAHPQVAPVRLRKRGYGWVAAVAMGLLVCIGGPVIASRFTFQPSAPADTPTRGQTTIQQPAEQAARVQEILTPARSDRTALIAAVQQISGCGDLDSALSSLERVREGRTTEHRQAQALQVSSLPQGTELAAALVDAMAHSLLADEAFIRWGQVVRSSGCSQASMQDGNRATADNESKLSTAAKQRFVSLWTPIAQQYGHPVIAYTEL